MDYLDYAPVFMLDKNEPFEIKAIGVSEFTEAKRSDSFPKREIYIDNKIKKVYEYAIWLDYDIQHLYELEHVWVYVGNDNNVIKVEGSFHGKYLNVENLDTNKPDLRDKTHPIVYMQPGKHAILSDKRLVRLIPGWYECCNEMAGIDGVDIHDFYADKVSVDFNLQEKVKKYIKDKYSFYPSLDFKEYVPAKDIFMTWEELKVSIPDRIENELRKVRQCNQEDSGVKE